MALNVTFSNVWGILLKEWKGVSTQTITVLVTGLDVYKRQEHTKRCRAVAEEMGKAQGDPCIMNLWVHRSEERRVGKECRPGTDYIPSDSQYCYISAGKYDLDIQS